jgi:hypothetical protein
VPRRAAIDQDAVEAALPPVFRQYLDETREMLYLGPMWSNTPGGPWLAAVAIVIRAAEYRRLGHPSTVAISIATDEMGVSVATFRTWCRRWQAASADVSS